MKTIIAITAAALALTLSGHASAQDSQDARSVMVSYADLDLGHDVGRATLERRVANAVRVVCPDSSGVDLKAVSLTETCRAKAWAGAKQQLAQIRDGRVFAQASLQIGPGKR